MSVVESKLAFRLVRIEVAAQPVDDSELVWAAWVTDDGADTLVMGYLRTAGPAGFGQARTVAIVSDRSLATEQSPGELEQWIRENVLEYLYDVGRRALNAQSASMDMSLDMPKKAPEIELERFGG